MRPELKERTSVIFTYVDAAGVETCRYGQITRVRRTKKGKYVFTLWDAIAGGYRTIRAEKMSKIMSLNF